MCVVARLQRFVMSARQRFVPVEVDFFLRSERSGAYGRVRPVEALPGPYQRRRNGQGQPSYTETDRPAFAAGHRWVTGTVHFALRSA